MSRTKIFVNETVIETDAPAGSPLLDFVREELGLVGTKEGCHEGDCGACAVVIGECRDGYPRYRAHPSCLAFVGELDGRHLLTIEGLAAAAERAGLEHGLTPVMRALLEQNGSQCGFCSPGFVMSLTGWLLEGTDVTEEGAMRAVDGNLCRCTGYASIRRAARLLIEEFADLPTDPVERIARLVKRGVVPGSALAFARDGHPAIRHETARTAAGGDDHGRASLPVGGGSDLAIRAPFAAIEAEPRFLRLEERLRRLSLGDGFVMVGAATSVRDFFESPVVRAAIPGIEAFETRFASTLVRNRATIGGNIANASPVADLTPIFLALGARLELEGPEGTREIALEGFFTGYRRTDLHADEVIVEVRFPVLRKGQFFNFEKLSKRENLDIASVNTGALLTLSEDGRAISDARISAGGVAVVPLLLSATAEFLRGKAVSAETALAAAKVASREVSPIDDVRGSSVYRREGLARLVVAHLMSLRPGIGNEIASATAGRPADGFRTEGGLR